MIPRYLSARQVAELIGCEYDAALRVVKAAGGIRDYAMACRMVAAGANRIGTSSGVALVGGGPAERGAY